MSYPGEFGNEPPVYRSNSPSPGKPDRSLIAILLLAVVALGGTIALLPGSEEKAEGLLAEGRYAEAIEILVSLEDERPLDAYEGYMLFKLFVLTKQADNAALLLAEEPALQAENVWALRQLSGLYREARNYSSEAAALRQLYDIAAVEADFVRLKTIYRLTGDAANEASLLVKAIQNGHSSDLHLRRLAYLRSVSEEASVVAVWLSPSGTFSGFAPVPSFQVQALSDLAAPTITLVSRNPS